METIGAILSVIDSIALTILFILFALFLIFPEFFFGFWNLAEEKNNPTTGTENMVGGRATVIDWSETSGRVNHDGESWKAVSKDIIRLEKGDKVTITQVDKLKLTVIKL